MNIQIKKYTGIILASAVILGGIASAAITPSFPGSLPTAVTGAVVKPSDVNTLVSAVQNLDKRAMQVSGTDITFLKSDGTARSSEYLKIDDNSNLKIGTTAGTKVHITPDGGLRLERPTSGVTDPAVQGFIDFDSDADGASYGRLKYDISSKMFKMINSETTAGLSINSSLHLGEAQNLGITLKVKLGNDGSVSCNTFCSGSGWGGWAGSCIGAVPQNGGIKTCGDTNPGNELACLCVTL